MVVVVVMAMVRIRCLMVVAMVVVSPKIMAVGLITGARRVGKTKLVVAVTI